MSETLISVDNSTNLWVEKYRPQKFTDIVLTNENKKLFYEYIFKDKEVPHILFYGTHGVGKTTMSKLLIKELGASAIKFNGSKDKKIEILRTKITQFASKESFLNDHTEKLVLLDEFEEVSSAFAKALKGEIEEFSKSVRFLLTTNNLAKVLGPIKDRCVLIDLVPQCDKKRKELIKGYYKRAAGILKLENVKFEKDALLELILKCYPSMRKILKILQMVYKKHGEIKMSAIKNDSLFFDDSFIELLKSNTIKNWKEVRKKAANLDPITFYDDFYEKIEDYLSDKALQKVAVLLAEYTYQGGVTLNKEINLVGFLTELMEQTKGEWK